MDKLVDLKLFWVDYYYPQNEKDIRGYLIVETGRKSAENACREMNEPDQVNISGITRIGKVGKTKV